MNRAVQIISQHSMDPEAGLAIASEPQSLVFPGSFRRSKQTMFIFIYPTAKEKAMLGGQG